MKKLAWFLFFVLSSDFVLAQNEYHVKGIPEKIIVYQSGANLKMDLKVNVKKGTNIIYIDSIPNNIDQNSIRIYTGATATLMSTDYRLEQIKSDNLPEPEFIKIIKDSINKVNFSIKDLNNKIAVLQGEEGIISTYKLHPETEKGSSIQELTTLANYYNKRIYEIKLEILNNQEKITAYNLVLSKLNSQINEYNASRQPINNYQIIATISSESDATINMELNVFTSQAWWTPNYELKVNDIDSPVTMAYKALVWQNTGRDWFDVKLVLSTRNPILNNIIPILNPWLLRLTEYKAISDDSMDSPLMPSSNAVRSRSSSETVMKVDGLEVGVVDNKYMTVEFSPTTKYSIKSDSRKQSITLNNVEVPAVYEYYCVPKLDPDAFLIAKITDWGKLNLLPGEAYIYFENSYIGKTTINPQSTDDSLRISLGRDKSIIINRETIKELTETKFLSSNIIKQYTYLITVKNNRKKEILITIDDQFPISTHSKIEVELLETSDAKIDNNKGLLRWIEKIPTGKSIKKQFGFKIDTPK